MALLSNRTGRVTATEDQDGDNRVTGRDDDIAAQRVADGTEAVATTSAAPSVTAPVAGRAQVDERLAAQRRLADRTAAAQAATETTTMTRPGDATVLAPVGPRPRASFWATLSLMFGIGAVVTVLTGVLAGPGVALGLVAALLGVAGISATSSRHVVGRANSLLAVALGLAAVVIGTLALTGTLSWLDASTNQVTHLHDWLAARVSWLFPASR